ncbi:MAG TPA: serine/threonine-protein kinase [Chloroflexia bacterium]|nr:serine/threonine-protein kinase [Chloroflexia bacterium]
MPLQGDADGKLLRNGEIRLLHRLGRGGMGSLYLAEDTTNGARRVVKELRTPANRKARVTFEAMFDSEAKLMERLSREHAAIPRYYDAFMDSGMFYIVIEFVPGEPLDQYLHTQGGSLPIAEALDYFTQMVDVLSVIHHLQPAPIVHGDIKPSNMMLRPDGRIILIDFGLARMNVNRPAYLPAGASAFGTPGYSPMEQWEGRPLPASDIFALGATAHHLITGRNPRLPFTHLSKVSLSELSALTVFPPITNLVPETPPMLETLVMQMLRRRAVERPPTDEVKLRLARINGS